MLTKQEIFDLVRDHLITQNLQCTNETNACLYRDGKGNACAVGCLIPNHKYRKEMEGLSVEQIKKNYPSCMPNIDLKNDSTIKLLGDLQSVHDDWDVVDWEKMLMDVQKYHELEW